MAYLRPVTKEAKRQMEKVDSIVSHRVRNKWYKELWFWIREHEEELVLIVTGILLLIISVSAYRNFMHL